MNAWPATTVPTPHAAVAIAAPALVLAIRRWVLRGANPDQPASRRTC